MGGKRQIEMEHILEHEARVAISDAYHLCSIEDEEGTTPRTIKFERDIRERIAGLRKAAESFSGPERSEFLARLDVAERVLNSRQQYIKEMHWKNELFTAIYQGDFDKVKQLTKHPDAPIDGMIDWAAACGNLEIVRYLHEVCHDPCIDDAICSATEAGATDVVEYLKSVQPVA